MAQAVTNKMKRFHSCCCVSRRQSGLRQVDPHATDKLTSGTLNAYRKAVMRFLCYLNFYALQLWDPVEFDDVLLEFKWDRAWDQKPPTKGEFATLISALQRIMPQLRGQLPMALAASKDWRAAVGTRHTPPLGKPWVFVVAVEMANQGSPRGGAILVTQYFHCLRPSEALQIRPSSVLMPMDTFHRRHGLIMLGRKSGTKAGRPQGVKASEPIALTLLKWLIDSNDGDKQLSGLSLSQYHAKIKSAMNPCNLQAENWSPHSARARFASDAVSEGIPFESLREFGRWTHDSSLRTYLDIVLVAGGGGGRERPSAIPHPCASR